MSTPAAITIASACSSPPEARRTTPSSRTAEHLADPHVSPRAERLDQRLRPVEVAVLCAPGAADDARDVETRYELCRLPRRNDPRRDVELVLQRDVLAHACERIVGVGEEEVTAGLEARIDPHVAVRLLRRRRNASTRARAGS